MTWNVGGVERPIRIVFGLLLLALAVFGGMPTMAVWVVGIIGAVMTLTGAVGFCPAWALFGINTCPIKTEQKD
jgi:hypothetical protein